MARPDPSSEQSKSIARRHFVRLGATGIAATATGCAAAGRDPEAAAPDEGARAGAAPGPSAGGDQAGPPAGGPPPPGAGPPPFRAPPAEVGDLVDPSALSGETWQEPWVWRQTDWPEEALELNVVQAQNLGRPTSIANPNSLIFSFNGTTPAPTIRARGESTVRIRLRNQLATNRLLTPVGPCPDPFEFPVGMRREVCELAGFGGPEDPACRPQFALDEFFEAVAVRRIAGYELVDHANGPRTSHTTNLHMHGLHVAPNYNPDGSLSDHVLARVIPKGDWERRRTSSEPRLRELRDWERVGTAEYAIRLGAGRHGAPQDSPALPHPPGTHWYHPHSHGSTHAQVASGMAGFFIVEGDVDDAINQAMTGQAHTHPEEKTGPYDYRERLMLFQRAIFGSFDLDAGPRRRQLRFPDPGLVNGTVLPTVITMRPGAVERWRVLNASVDGSGFKRFMVLEGQYVNRANWIYRVDVEEPAAGDPPGERDQAPPAGPGAGPPGESRRLVPVDLAEIEAAKLPLHLLAFDGITLVEEDRSGALRHTIEDLSRNNAATGNPYTRPLAVDEPILEGMRRNFEDCFRDGDALRRAFVRPNEVYMATANRADVLFKAPLDAAGRTFTVFAQEAEIDSDILLTSLQASIGGGGPPRFRPNFNIVVAYIHVRGEPVEGGDFDLGSLRDVLPPVPPLLRPVHEVELRAPAPETRARGVPEGSLRTRVLAYSGYGGVTFPLVEVPEAYARAHPELERLTWYREEGRPLLLPNFTRTMAIHPRFDLASNPDPGPPRKFSPDHEDDPKVLRGSAEEWVLYNNSTSLWGETDTEKHPQPGRYGGHFEAGPMVRADGIRRNHEEATFGQTTPSNDHPFHIHINPMWVIRIDMPDENGVLHNVLPRPRWMDTVPIPRNGGRVVFRSRFVDYPGTWVHHCHLLMHEDAGMMQTMHCTEDPARTDWNPRRRVASHEMPAEQVDAIYPRPSLELMYRQSMSFIDPSPATGHEYPGFELEVPTPPPPPESAAPRSTDG